MKKTWADLKHGDVIEFSKYDKGTVIVITLTIFLIKMLAPWEYDHQFKDFWEQIRTNLTNPPNDQSK